MKLKVTIMRTEYRSHDFEVQVPDGTDPSQIHAAAADSAFEEAYNTDWHNIGSASVTVEYETTCITEEDDQ